MIKKYMVRCDIEGVSGVVSYEQVEPGKPEYAFAQRMFMAELLALLEGLTEGGAEELIIYDEHFFGRNIEIDRLPDNASAICGKPHYRADWAGGLDQSCTGLILLGFHSKAGTHGGLLPHSYELDIEDITLNKISVGEIGVEAAIAGDYGVPTILMIGDSAGAREAQELLPGIAVVSVKESLSKSGAHCYPLSVTTARIREAAKKAAAGNSHLKPYTLGDRVEMKVRLRKRAYLLAMQRLYPDVMADEHTVLIEGCSATEVWAHYWALKLRCQADAEM